MTSSTARVLPFPEQPKTVGWSWGVPKLDKLIGPISPGRLYLIGARPSCGKTAFLMNIVSRIIAAVMDGKVNANGQPWKILAWFTERSRRVALKSLAALQLHYDEDLVLRSAWRDLPDGAQQKVEERVAVLGDMWPGFVCMDDMGPTIESLQYDVKHFRCESGDETYYDQPEILVLDYLQMIRPMRGQHLADAMRETLQWFRQLAGEGKTVIVTSQLKRRGDGVMDKYRPPHLEDFFGGGLIEATAEVALGLFRPLNKMTSQQAREVKEGRATLEQWMQPGVMAIKCVKHTYLGPAADGMVRARIASHRLITPYETEQPPLSAGDAWEDDDKPPF